MVLRKNSDNPDLCFKQGQERKLKKQASCTNNSSINPQGGRQTRSAAAPYFLKANKSENKKNTAVVLQSERGALLFILFDGWKCMLILLGGRKPSYILRLLVVALVAACCVCNFSRHVATTIKALQGDLGIRDAGVTTERWHPRTVQMGDNGTIVALFHDNLELEVSSENNLVAAGEVEEEVGDCKAQYAWQRSFSPSCNSLFELDIATLLALNHSRGHILGYGHWRDVWIIPDGEGTTTNEYVALKTLRMMHDYTRTTLGMLHQRDAVIMDRLTSSRHVLDIYAFCGTDGIFEVADGGDLSATLFPDDRPDDSRNDIPKLQKLRIAVQIAKGLADTHNSDLEGRAAIAHKDLYLDQFVNAKGVFKINDFNLAELLTWNMTDDTPCSFISDSNTGNTRSPEEYNYQEQTEMVDVFALGNALYSLLQDKDAFEDVVKSEDVGALVIKGERPEIDSQLRSSTNPIDQVLQKCIILAQREDYKERATARS